jgi:hypothetical protein
MASPRIARTPRAAVRIGCGAGFSSDRIDPAVELAEKGNLDFLFFECLAERTLALGHLAKLANPAAGYNTMLERRLAAVLPGCRANGTRIVSNMGAANPAAAGEAAAEVARKLGFSGIKIAVVEGDDVTEAVPPDAMSMDSGQPLARDGMIAANAYLGGDLIARALDQGADIVITGRVADPSLVVGPLMHAFGWAQDDWNRLGAGTLVGHLLECSAQITGGYFADPGLKDVSGLARLGYPLAEVQADGSAVITKVEGSGGCITPLTVKEQMLYEVHDPAAYLTPDVTADFSKVSIAEVGKDRIAVSNARGLPRPERLKALAGFRGGYLAEAEISYAGPGAAERGRLAAAILKQRITDVHGCSETIRFDLIGLNALHGATRPSNAEPQDVRLRAAMRSADRAMCETLVQEMEALWIAGPAGGGGMRGTVTPTVATDAFLVDRAAVRPRITVIQA